MINKATMKQYGFIVFGAGMNTRRWLDDAKAQGYRILLADNHAQLWK